VVYCFELRYVVESRMVVVGVGDGGGYAPAWWNCVCWMSSNNAFFLPGFVLL